MRLRALAFVVAACLLSCGSGDGPGPAPPSDPGDTSGGGGGGDPGGGGTPGGSGDPGGGGGGQGPGDGPDAGPTAPVRSADGTALVERTDFDRECNGLVPSRAPDAVAADVRERGASCGATGLSDGRGHVAVAAQAGGRFVVWQVFSATGARERTFTLHTGGGPAPGLFAQAEGWQGVLLSNPGSSRIGVDVVTFFGDGAPRERRTATPSTDDRNTGFWSIGEDPLGGTVVAHSGIVQRGRRACAGEVDRFDERGLERGPPGRFGSNPDFNCVPIATAASNRGEALVVEGESGSASGRAFVHWIALDGTTVAHGEHADISALFPRGESVELAPLLDGSLAVREGVTWTRRFPHLGTQAENAPAWLSARPGWRYRFTRGNLGYALLPPDGLPSADCSQRIEIVAPSGRVCGRVTFTEPGGACSTTWIDQGWDGTVVQKSARESCTWRWWPRLLENAR